ncbi:MAG: type I secretion system permease/ATPase [Xanthobacteraceae bacterium]|nr:type I secretion system permease/ATPase [Xanthobacteraceae bacterium]
MNYEAPVARRNGIDRAALADALDHLFRHFGKAIDADALLNDMAIDGILLSSVTAAEALRRARFNIEAGPLVPEALSSLNLPVLVITEDYTPMVVTQRDGDIYKLISFLDEPLETTIDSEMLAATRSTAIYLRPDREDSTAPLAEQDEPRKTERRWVFETLYPLRHYYYQILMASFAINVLAVASPLFIMNVYDRIIPNLAYYSLWVLAAGMLLALTFDFTFKYLRDLMISGAGRGLDLKLSMSVVEQALRAKIAARPGNAGQFINQIREYESFKEFFSSNNIALLADLSFFLVYIVVIAVISPLIAGVVLLFFTAGVLLGWLFNKSSGRLIEGSSREAAIRNAFLFESIAASETIKSSRAEGFVLSRWRDVVAQTGIFSEKIRRVMSNATNLAAFLQQFVSVVIILVAIYRFEANDISMGGIIACVILSGRALGSLSGVVSVIARARHTLHAYHTLDRLFSMETEDNSADGLIHTPPVSSDVEFRTVRFAYPGSPVTVLNDLSMKVNAGERVAIIGRVGCGKTTIGRLLVQFYTPDSGLVLFGGVDVKQFTPHNLRSLVGFVSQDSILFHGSVRDNIRFGLHNVPEESLIEPAQIAGVMEFTNLHPRGLDMPVGEGGRLLSSGQRKAVIMARALLVQPRVLFLDEPTSDMDQLSERIFVQNLKNSLKPTQSLIVTTHRNEILKIVDRIVVIERGRVVMDGPRDAVLAKLVGKPA